MHSLMSIVSTTRHFQYHVLSLKLPYFHGTTIVSGYLILCTGPYVWSWMLEMIFRFWLLDFWTIEHRDFKYWCYSFEPSMFLWPNFEEKMKLQLDFGYNELLLRNERVVKNARFEQMLLIKVIGLIYECWLYV